MSPHRNFSSQFKEGLASRHKALELTLQARARLQCEAGMVALGRFVIRDD